MNFSDIIFKRTIVHKIFSKKDKVEPFAETAIELTHLETDTEDALKKRILTAIKKTKRFFETEIYDTSSGSFWALASTIPSSSKASFVSTTTSIAELAATKHDKGYIPGGLLIILDCEIDNYPSVIVIKAELQEAFSLAGNILQLIKELFLSPAKELYKIAFLIQNKTNKSSAASYSTYIYDDHFTPKNNDLATYFYKDFLGLTTSQNDKLLTNNFFKDFELFVDKYIPQFEDRRNLKTSLKNDLRAEEKGIIDPTTYVDLFPTKLKQSYENEILTKYGNSFSKDLTLVDHALSNYTIEVTSKIKLSASSDEVDKIDILDGGVERDMKKVITRIDAGTINKVILIANSNNDNPGFKKRKVN